LVAICHRLRRREKQYWKSSAASTDVQIATKIEMNSGAAGWGDAASACSTCWTQALARALDLAKISRPPHHIGSGLNFAGPAVQDVPSGPSFDAYVARCAARSGVPARRTDSGSGG